MTDSLQNSVLQSQAAECGIGCLVIVASVHGQNITLDDLRRKFKSSLHGVSLRILMAQAAALGYSSRPLRAELHNLHNLKLPCILHWDLNHFVVLKKVGPKTLRHLATIT